MLVAHHRRNAAAETRSPATPRPITAALRCKGATVHLRRPSRPPRPCRRPGPSPRWPWLPPLPVPSPPQDAADDRPLRLRAQSRQERSLRARNPQRKHVLVLLDPVFVVFPTEVLACSVQEHARVSENRWQRHFPNPVLAYVTPWCVISAIRCMFVVFGFIVESMYCCTIKL